MTVAELRDLANNSHNSPENAAQYNRIMKAAKQRALKGGFRIWFYENISEVVKSYLANDGIKCENTFDSDGPMFEISWE